jgi:hypothetical protein
MSKVDFKAWKTSNMLVTHPIVQSEISILEYKIEQRDQRIAELENLLTAAEEAIKYICGGERPEFRVYIGASAKQELDAND